MTLATALTLTLTGLSPAWAQDAVDSSDPANKPDATTRTAPSGGNLLGHRGLLRTLAAFNHPAGLIAIGADLQFFSASGFLADNQDHSRMVNTYSITWAPLSFLEAALAINVISDNSSQGADTDLQVAVGDPQLSVKGGYRFGDVAFGGAVDVRFASGSGFFEAAGAATNVRINALASFSPGALPLSLHVNTGFAIDGSKNLFDAPDGLSAAQRYAAQISSFNRVLLRFGAEYEFEYVSPFVELSLEPFVGSGAPSVGSSPGVLSLGARVWPNKSHGLQLLAALDIGITGVGNGRPGDPAPGKYAYVLPRWNLVFRLSYRFDPFAKPRTVVRTVVKRGPGTPAPAAAKRGRVSGRVVDGRSGEAVGEARVAIGGDGVSGLAVEPRDGSFKSYGLSPGKHVVKVTADGYKPSSVEVEVKPGGETKLTLKLQPRGNVPPGTLRGQVKAVGGRRLRNVTVLVPQIDKTIRLRRGGAFKLQLKPGTYTVVVSARGYRTQRKKVRVREAATVILNVELHRR